MITFRFVDRAASVQVIAQVVTEWPWITVSRHASRQVGLPRPSQLRNLKVCASKAGLATPMPTNSNHNLFMNVQTGNPQISKPGQRRQFRWGKQERDLVLSQLNASAIHFSALISSLEQMSGNPRWACRRFARALGVKARRTQRNWTSQERQRLVKLLDLYPVPEISRLLRRSESSIWHMVSRVGANAKIGRDSFTIYSLAFALHVRPEKVQDWIARGWLKTRDVETTAGFRTVIEADDFCQFCRRHTRDAVGNRLSRERLEFVYHFAFPPSHAELLPVRESKKERTWHDEWLKAMAKGALNGVPGEIADVCEVEQDAG